MTDFSGIGSGIPTSFREAGRRIPDRVLDLLAAFQRGVRQCQAYEDLSRLSDTQLSSRGLKRRDIVRHVVESVR